MQKGMCLVMLFVGVFTILNQPSPATGICRRIARYTLFDCEPPWQAYENNCYLFVGVSRNYQDAEQYCQSHSEQWRPCHLASILSDDEGQFIYNITGGVNKWIGYNDLAVEGVYTWSDGSPTGYEKWRSGFPVGDAYGNQDCIHTFGGLEWKEYYCSDDMRAICKMPRHAFV